MCRRSVSRRSPPTSASTRAGRPAMLAASITAARPRLPNSSSHVRSVSATSSVRSSPRASRSAAVWPKKQVSAADRTRVLRCGCSSASSSVSQSTTRRGREDAAATGDHAGDADVEERGLRVGEVGVAVADDRDVARPHGAPVERGAGVEQAAYVVGEVARDPRPHLRHRQQPGSPRDVLPPDHAHPERVAGPDQAALGVVGLDVADHDPLVAERGPAQQLLHRREQRRVAAPVDRQRLLGRRGGGRGEVGRDVAAAERVDGLLGVADQHHRGVAAEGPVEHLPLHRVGVLELVDQHDLPPLPHPLGRRRRRRGRARRRAG